MKRKLKKNLVASSLAIALMAIPVITAFGATYTSYALSPRQGNNYTGSHAKSTADQNMVNTVTALTHTDTATFWANDGVKTQASNDYDQKVNNTTTIQFRNQISKGSDVILGMQNANWELIQNGFVSGDVDFK
ncbi:hypothetical protein PMSD_10335 [Paenibacillus macquariensis subsp. defensor]|nr:hypothetical protein PMSD_10335 [Paenibacillus macquariensis subsp. defensor]